MRANRDPKEDSAAGITPAAPWRVSEVRALPGYRLHVRFVDGTEGDVDVSDLILGENPGVFAPLRDPERFAEAFVSYGAVTWPGELDLAPDAMYDEIKSRRS